MTKRHVESLERRDLFALNALYASPAGLSSDGDNPRDMMSFGDRVIFAAESSAKLGQELFISDGTLTGTRLLADLNAGEASSGPIPRVDAGSLAFFTAVGTGDVGGSVYRTDGKGAGTFRVWKAPAPMQFAEDFIPFNDQVIFAARGATNWELYASDGKRDAAVQLTNQLPIGDSDGPEQFTFVNGKLFFMSGDGARDYVWVTDGTPGGTRPIALPGDEAYGMWAISDRLYVSGRVGTTPKLFAFNPKTLERLSESTETLIYGAAGNYASQAVVFGINTKTRVAQLFRHNGSAFRRIDSGFEFSIDSMKDSDFVVGLEGRPGEYTGDLIFSVGTDRLLAIAPDSDRVRTLLASTADAYLDLAGVRVIDGDRYVVLSTVGQDRQLLLGSLSSSAAPARMNLSDVTWSQGEKAFSISRRGVFFVQDDWRGSSGASSRTNFPRVCFAGYDDSEALILTGEDRTIDEPTLFAAGNASGSIHYVKRRPAATRYSRTEVLYVRPDHPPKSLAVIDDYISDVTLSAVVRGDYAFWMSLDSAHNLELRRTDLRNGDTILCATYSMPRGTYDQASGIAGVASNGSLIVPTAQGYAYNDWKVEMVTEHLRILPPEENPSAIVSLDQPARRYGFREFYPTRVVPISGGRTLISFEEQLVLTQGTGDTTKIAASNFAGAIVTAKKKDRFQPHRIRDVAAAGDRAVALVAFRRTNNEAVLADTAVLKLVTVNLDGTPGTVLRDFGVRHLRIRPDEAAQTEVDANGVLWIRIDGTDSGSNLTGRLLLRVDPGDLSIKTTLLDSTTDLIGHYNGSAVLRRVTTSGMQELQIADGVSGPKTISPLSKRGTWRYWNAGKHFFLDDGLGQVYRYTNGIFARAFATSQLTTAWVDPNTSSMMFGGVLTDGTKGSFHHTPTLSLAGTVYNDVNRNGTQDGNEKGLRGWRVFLDRDGDKVWDKNEQAIRASSSGRYEFYDLPKGTFSVCVTMVEGFTPISAIPMKVTLKKNQSGVIKRLGVAALL